MKKMMYFVGLFVIIAACEKENPNDVALNGQQGEEFQESQSGNKSCGSNDGYLCEAINSSDMDCYDKGALLLNEENDLSSTVCNSLVSNADNFEESVLEVVLSSQSFLSDEDLISIINHDGITDGTVESILYSQSPLSGAVVSATQANRPSIDLSAIASTNGLDKLLCLCEGRMYFAEKIIVTKTCGETSFILENFFSRPLSHSIDPENQEKLAGGCGGKWTCGNSKVTDKGDGISVIQCTVPPETKCAKIIRTEPKSFSSGENGILSMLSNSNASDFVKGSHVLNQESISDNLMSEIIDLACEMNPYVIEVILLTSGKISQDNLVKIINQPAINDATVTNILAVNSPIDNRIGGLITKLRPGISVSYVNSFADKDMLVTMCCQSITVGSNIIVTEIDSKTHEIMTFDKETLSFGTSAQESDINVLAAGGGGKWIKGEVSVSSTHPNGSSVTYCVAPPNVKCAKVVKSN